MDDPLIADVTPVRCSLDADRKYFWCACGRSANQPFCDGSHAGTGITPVAFTAEKAGTAFLCACKQTGKTPYCDGTHARFSADDIGSAPSGGSDSDES